MIYAVIFTAWLKFSEHFQSYQKLKYQINVFEASISLLMALGTLRKVPSLVCLEVQNKQIAIEKVICDSHSNNIIHWQIGKKAFG